MKITEQLRARREMFVGSFDHLIWRPGGQPMNSGGLLPKTLAGSLQQEWRRCGTPRCRCASGTLHGPYWYLRWREGSRQRRQYVPREQVNAMRAAIAQRRRLHPPAWSLRQELAELRQLAQEVRDDRHDC